MTAIPDLTPQQAKVLVTWLDTTAYLEDLSNALLADLLLEHIWATYAVTSPQGMVLAEVITRLRRLPDVTP